MFGFLYLTGMSADFSCFLRRDIPFVSGVRTGIHGQGQVASDLLSGQANVPGQSEDRGFYSFCSVVPLLNQAGVSIQNKTVVSRELQTRGSHTSSGWGSLDCVMMVSYKEIR